MNKKNWIVKAAGTAFALSLCLTMYAQKEYPKPEGMRPGMSEYWTPQPPVVTPGDPATLSAPSDAIVLFDGKNLSAWESVKGGEAKWEVSDGKFTVVRGTGDIRTKDTFESFQLHIEWRMPENITGESQGRGNSGVFLQGMYEIQILDCYENETYVNGQTGSVYKQTPPLVNAMRKPGEWNVYDIIYTAPIFKEDGTYLYPPRVTVIQNGIVLQNNTTILGTTEYIGFPQVKPHGAGPIKLQDHGDPVQFRNIWLRKL
ncbi:MAG: DUF1080 domain-containing protein [Tannerellaceae bacterium]|nr:DUF1080 domain-containing protein [Tannerellaceae bacterium]